MIPRGDWSSLESAVGPRDAAAAPPGPLPLVDILTVACAWPLAYAPRWVAGGAVPGPLGPFADHLWHTPTVVLLWWAACVVLRRAGLGPEASGGGGWLWAWLTAGGAGAGFAALAWAFWPAKSYSRGVALTFVVLAGALLVLGRTGYARWRAGAARWLERAERCTGEGLLAALGRPVRAGRAGELTLIALGVLLLAASYVYTAVAAELVPCALYCAEWLEAYIAGLNRVRFGVWWTAGLPDLGLSADAGAHPKLYTHQGQISSWVSYAGHVLGIREVEGQALLVLPVWAGGLAYMARFVGGATGQRLLGGLMLVAAGTLYPLVTLWAFNPLRAFSWLVVWGSAYHAWRHGATGRFGHLVAVLVYVGLSFGIDYASVVYVGVQLLVLAGLGVIRVPWRRLLGWQAAVLGGVWLVHQGQVVALLGAAGWARDTLDVALRRLPLLTTLGSAFGLQPGTLTDATESGGASAARVARWPVEHRSTDVAEWIGTTAAAYVEVVGGLIIVVAVLWVVAAWLLSRRPAGTDAGFAGTAPRITLRVVAAHALGNAAALAAVPGYYTTAFGRDLMPMPVHVITLLLALTAFVLVAGLGSGAERTGPRRVVAAGLLLVLGLWRVSAEIGSYRRLPPSGESARHALRQVRGETVASTLHPALLSAYTHEWAAFLNRRGLRKLIEAPGVALDPARDLTVPEFFVADPKESRYRRPAYLLVRPDLPRWRCGPALVNWPVRRPGDSGCVALERAERELAHLPLVSSGPRYRLYDLRPSWSGRSD